MFWLDDIDAEGATATTRGELRSDDRAARRVRFWLIVLTAFGCLLAGGFVLVTAASGSRPGAKPAVLPDAPFVLPNAAGGAVALPPVPTQPATPLPRNQHAAGGANAPAPCEVPDRATHVRIPRLCIDAEIVPSPSHGNELQIPRDVSTVGLWTGGQPLTEPDGSPGSTGSTLVAGHVDDVDQGNGALHDLYLTQPGEAVYVTDVRGRTVRWRAVAMQVVVKSALPKALFAGRDGPRRLYLVTCGGALLHVPDGSGGTVGTYEDNVIVTLVPG